ncbi:MAG: hypothetical protein ACK4TN_06960, partial [Brevinematales bacterium]
MKEQTRKTPPEKPKTASTREKSETSSSTATQKKPQISSWWEKMWSPLSTKTSTKKPSSPSWQVTFERFTPPLNPANIVFTIAGGGMAL